MGGRLCHGRALHAQQANSANLFALQYDHSGLWSGRFIGDLAHLGLQHRPYHLFRRCPQQSMRHPLWLYRRHRKLPPHDHPSTGRLRPSPPQNAQNRSTKANRRDPAGCSVESDISRKNLFFNTAIVLRHQQTNPLQMGIRNSQHSCMGRHFFRFGQCL